MRGKRRPSLLSRGRELHPVEARLATVWPPQQWQSQGVILALSGGADSVALFRAMLAISPPGRECSGGWRVGHFNHRLRGSASDEDAQWVQKLCQSWAVPCQIGVPQSDQDLRSARGRTSEALARKARYAFLRQVAEQHGFRYVAVAHTADDQVETILHRIVRGTGLAGLAGMRRARPLSPAVSLVRPLLTFTRQELRQYLADVGQNYRQDASNEDLRFTRNRIRHQLVPLLQEQFNPKVEDAILRLGQVAGEVADWIHLQATRLLEETAFPEGKTWVFRADRLAGEPRFLLRELFRLLWIREGWPQQPMGQAEWELLAQAIPEARSAPYGKVARWTLPGAILVEAGHNTVRIYPPLKEGC